jgi:hypothetical protein
MESADKKSGCSGCEKTNCLIYCTIDGQRYCCECYLNACKIDFRSKNFPCKNCAVVSCEMCKRMECDMMLDENTVKDSDILCCECINKNIKSKELCSKCWSFQQ